MASAKLIQKDINIYYVNNGRKHLLPYAFNDFNPTFCWDVPEGVSQKYFVFEMRTRYPVLHSDGVTYRCAYHNSSKLQNPDGANLTAIKPEYSIINALDQDSWKGCCEVRLTIYGTDGKIYCTHESTDEQYDFEAGVPQYKKWGSKRDELYFVFDESIVSIKNQLAANLRFSSATDDDIEQTLSYDFQVSRTPLFGEGNNGNVINWSNLSASGQTLEVPVVFQNEKNPENFEAETADSLYPNTMYFMRARAFDGFDHGAWSDVNAFTCVLNTIPVCHIVSVEYPGGEFDDRPNGEMKIRCYVTDDDNKRVSVAFAYSMQPIELGYDSYGNPNYGNPNLIRAKIVESTLVVPTSSNGASTSSDYADDYPGDENLLEFTWLTSDDIQNVQVTGVCLFMFCFDGISSGIYASYQGIEIDNRGIGSSIGNVSMPAQKFWLKGNMQYNLAYAVLPKDMLEQVLPYGNAPEQDAKESIRGWVGNAQGYKNWFDFWQKYEKNNGINGLRRIVYDSEWNLTEWDKYPTRTYQNGISFTPQPNSAEIIGTKDGQLVHIYILNNDEWTSNATINHVSNYPTNDGSGYVAFEQLVNYNGEHALAVSFIDNEGNPRTAGFISFCPECHTLQPLVSYREGNQVLFRCPKCRRIYPMQTRYHDLLAFGVWFHYASNVYAYYNGYNSSTSSFELTKHLQLMMQTEFDRLKEEWKEQHESNSDSFPYEFAQIKKWYKEKDKNPYEQQTNQEIIVKDNERFGFMPPDKLLKLNPRPEIDSFLRIKPNFAESLHQALYIDGMELNASVKKDFAHGFDESTSEGETAEITADKNAVKELAKQQPWSIFNKLTYMYSEGKNPIEQDKSYEEGGSAGEQDGQRQEQEQEEGKDALTSPEICVVFDGESASVGYTTMQTPNGALTYIYNRMSYSGVSMFSMSIQRDVNDRFAYSANNGDAILGSILPQGIDVMHILMPGALSESDGNYASWIGAIKQIFPEELFSVSVTQSTEHSIHYMALGQMVPTLKSYCLLECENSCYGTFGLKPFETHQSYQKFSGQLGYNGYVRRGSFPKTETQDSTHQYYYTSTTRAKHRIHAEECPVDNQIEVVYNQAGGNSTGEPLFTCDKNEVDANGYHFRYSEEEYARTHRIYIRKYHLETCNPFPHPIFGYKNWTLVPIEGRNGRYKRKRVLNGRRGSAPEMRMIDVMLDNGTLTREWGWFKPGVEDLPEGKVRGECISHEKMEVSDSQSQIPEEDIPFIRKEDYTWRNQLIPQECAVFEYVDIEEALKKNPTDLDNGYAPLTHKNPFGIMLSYKQLFKRYGKYVMGAYELSKDQKQLDSETRTVWAENEFGERQLKLEENTYQKRFVETMRVVDENNRVVEREVEFYEEMPNNYREAMPGAVFVVEKEQGKTITTHIIPRKKNGPDTASVKTYDDRYKKIWDDIGQPPHDAQNDGELSQITVEPWNPGIAGKFAIVEKWGYEPMHKVGKYWSVDEDGVYGGKYIPLESTVVHAIYKHPGYDKPGDPFGDYRVVNNYMAERHIVSDKTFKKVDDTYDKMPWLDYRLKSNFPYEEKNYFSGYPKCEHELFEGRPEPVYPYDRQWRIVNNYDMLTTYGNWGFIYLQNQWNNYNRVHWVAAQDEDVYAIIRVLDITENTGEEEFEREFSLKTLTSIWVDEFNAWCIPYKNNDQSDIIDTTQNQFIDGHAYRFVLQTGNKYTHALSTQVYSINFSISRQHPSPATIVDTSYDPWTGVITLVFRFDDAMGRTYDITGVQYALSDPDLDAGDNQDGNAGHWKSIDMENIVGRVQDLASNDGTEIGSLIVRHAVKFNASCLSELRGATDSLRIRIVSDVSVNRKGLTLPMFYIKMWANEFLKIAEDSICKLQGSKSRWKWVETTEEDGTTTGAWQYLSEEKAITTLGRIQETQGKIDGLNEKFEDFYVGVAKFERPDLDAYECYLRASGLWDAFYYGSLVFEAFLNENDFTDEFMEYAAGAGGELPEQSKKENWLYKTGRSGLLKYWFDQRRLDLLKHHFVSSGVSSSFQSWLLSVAPSISASQSMIEYCKLSPKNYADYWNARGVNVVTIESNSEGDQVEVYEYTNDLCEGYINSNETIRSNWLNYYSNANLYADTRQVARARIVELHRQEFEEYLQSSDFNWFVESDHNAIAMQYFIAEKLPNEYVENAGRSVAMLQFMQNRDASGMPYSMKYQSYNEEIAQYRAQLQESILSKQQLETDFRIKMVRQGFFGNGFENNQPFTSTGDVNTCFRWRVETRPYEGTIVNNTAYDENGVPTYAENENVNGYQDRYDMYFRTQLDFFDTFDSQAGRKPLRDMFFVFDGQTDACRLLATIADANNTPSTMPDSVLDGEQTNNTNKDSLQFSGSFALAKNECPGQVAGDRIPEGYARPDGANGFESIYYWRTASYNLVETPVLGNIQGDSVVEKIADYVTPSRTYSHYKCIVSSKSYHDAINAGAPNWQLLYAATKLAQPIWQKNIESKGFVGAPSTQYNTGQPIMPKHYACDWVNKNMLDRGEVCFVTDRPRKLKEAENLDENPIELIEDNIGNYDTMWYPSGVERQKPCVVRFNHQYLLFSHKQIGVRAYSGKQFIQYQITMSRGFASDVFGEECQCFPRYCNEDPKEIKLADGTNGNAIGFLNANVVQLPSGSFRMYFNAQKYDNKNSKFYTEIWMCDTADFDEFTNFKVVEMSRGGTSRKDILQPFVCISGTGENPIYEMFCVSPNESVYGKGVISRYTSRDGVNFEYQEKIGDSETEDYDCKSPCLVRINENTERLYIALEPVAGNDERHAAIVSRDRVDGVWHSDATKGAYKVEFSGSGQQNGKYLNFALNFTTMTNPFVLWDTDNFTPVLRIYYNELDNPYVYNGTELELCQNALERTIHTQYLEEYPASSWVAFALAGGLAGNPAFYNEYGYGEPMPPGMQSTAADAWFTNVDDQEQRATRCQYILQGVENSQGGAVYVCPMCVSDDGMNWKVVRINYSSTTNGIDFPASLEGKYIRFEFVLYLNSWDSMGSGNDTQNVSAIKIRGVTPKANNVRCIAQSKWIDWKNIFETEATMMPEQQEDYEYSVGKYTYQAFIEKENLRGEYAAWKEENSQNYDENTPAERMQLDFLVDRLHYSDYLWWSRKGPGIYRYLPIVQEYKWDGDTKKPAPLP